MPKLNGTAKDYLGYEVYTLEVRKADFGRGVVSSFSQIGGFFTAALSGSNLSHQWLIGRLGSGAGAKYFTLQFAGAIKNSPEIEVDIFDTYEQANHYCASIAGSNRSYQTIHPERNISRSLKLREIVNAVGDENYNLATNNCQHLASRLYGRFSEITSDEVSDYRRNQALPIGVSRLPDGRTHISCSIL